MRKCLYLLIVDIAATGALIVWWAIRLGSQTAHKVSIHFVRWMLTSTW